MSPISELREILNGHFNWNKARITCFATMVLALFAVKTVNLTEIACAMMTDKANLASRYRRLQRFFSQFKLDLNIIAGFLFKLFLLQGGRWYLTLDRTNWQWGQTDINVLMLAVAYKGLAIPLYWKLLNKRGNSDTAERIELLNQFIEQFGKTTIAGLLADREFIGKDWFGYLITQAIPFYIRIKHNSVTTNARGLEVDADSLFYGVLPHEQRVLAGKRKLWGHRVYLAGLRLQDGELLIIATTEAPKDAVEIYARRWEIETLFQSLKGRGFRFEETRLTQAERIEKLVALLAIAFCWAYKTGEWRHESQTPLRIKKHGRLIKSLFRYGLDLIREAIFKGVINQWDQLNFCLQFINLLPETPLNGEISL